MFALAIHVHNGTINLAEYALKLSLVRFGVEIKSGLSLSLIATSIW